MLVLFCLSTAEIWMCKVVYCLVAETVRDWHGLSFNVVTSPPPLKNMLQ